jgi:hypothetical protein
MTDPEYEGGCLCGATRFRAAGAASQLCYCHCRSCRGASGAPFVAWATFPAAGFRIARGALALHRSSEPVLRGFCATCGTALTYAHAARPAEIDVALAALDDPGVLRPACHIWVSHKLPWVELGDGLPRFAEWRTETMPEPGREGI